MSAQANSHPHSVQLTPAAPLVDASLYYYFFFFSYLICDRPEHLKSHLAIPTTPKVPVSQTLLWVKVKTHVLKLRKYPVWYTAGHVIIHREREKGLGWFWEIQHIWQFLLPSRGPKCFAKRRDDRATPTPCSLDSHALTHSLNLSSCILLTFSYPYFVHTYI